MAEITKTEQPKVEKAKKCQVLTIEIMQKGLVRTLPL